MITIYARITSDIGKTLALASKGTIKMAGIKLNAVRVINYFRGPEVRANSTHTSMTGLLKIYETSSNAAARDTAGANICMRILSKSFTSSPAAGSLSRRLPTDLFKTLCVKMEENFRGGMLVLESPFYAIVGEFGLRMDAGGFSVSDNEARKALKNIIARLGDRGTYRFIIDRLTSDRRDFMLSMIPEYPEIHEKLLSGLLYQAKSREKEAERANAIEAIGDLVNISHLLSDEAHLIKLYMSVGDLLHDRSETLLIGSKVIESGTEGNGRKEYDYDVAVETYIYPLIRNTKMLLEKIGPMIKDENTRARIAADLKAAPADEFEKTNKRCFNESGSL